jgi:hypothetical protein
MYNTNILVSFTDFYADYEMAFENEFDQLSEADQAQFDVMDIASFHYEQYEMHWSAAHMN